MDLIRKTRGTQSKMKRPRVTSSSTRGCMSPRAFLKLQVSEQTKMASIYLSPIVRTGCVQTKTSPSMSFMAFSWIPPIKSSLGSSKSTLFQHGLSLQSSYSNGRFFKSRSLGVYARAATEKTLYDFTVKVYLPFI